MRVLTALFWAVATVVSAQSFESASITPSLTSVKLAGERGELIGWKIDPPLVRAGHTSLANLILQAYEIKPIQLQGPAWGLSPIPVDSGEGLFDLEARMPPGASADQIPTMLQNLLAERFRLKTHLSISEREFQAITLAEGGPKFARTDARSPLRTYPIPTGVRIEASSIADLAGLLAVNVGRAPVDQTGLQGSFDIRLDLPSIPDYENIQAALKSIGLDLGLKRERLETTVVDYVEREPVGN